MLAFLKGMGEYIAGTITGKIIVVAVAAGTLATGGIVTRNAIEAQDQPKAAPAVMEATQVSSSVDINSAVSAINQVADSAVSRVQAAADSAVSQVKEAAAKAPASSSSVSSSAVPSSSTPLKKQAGTPTKPHPVSPHN